MRRAGPAERLTRVVGSALAASTLAVSIVAAVASSGDEAARAAGPEVIGHSVGDRAIEATMFGNPAAEHVVLVVGIIHGDEKAGHRVIEQIRARVPALENAQLWLINTVNPDGQVQSSRKNAHAVDLNRNFPFRWRGGTPKESGYYPGPKPASEPETRAVMDFVSRIKPDVSIWYHQDWNAVLACRGRPAAGAAYAKLAGMRTSCRGNRLHGTAVSWEQHVIDGAAAFVVELPARVGAGQVASHAEASIAMAEGG